MLRSKGMVSPILVIDASPDGAPLYACAFNGKRPDMFATGGVSGIQVWGAWQRQGGSGMFATGGASGIQVGGWQVGRLAGGEAGRGQWLLVFPLCI